MKRSCPHLNQITSSRVILHSVGHVSNPCCRDSVVLPLLVQRGSIRLVLTHHRKRQKPREFKGAEQQPLTLLAVELSAPNLMRVNECRATRGVGWMETIFNAEIWAIRAEADKCGTPRGTVFTWGEKSRLKKNRDSRLGLKRRTRWSGRSGSSCLPLVDSLDTCIPKFELETVTVTTILPEQTHRENLMRHNESVAQFLDAAVDCYHVRYYWSSFTRKAVSTRVLLKGINCMKEILHVFIFLDVFSKLCSQVITASSPLSLLISSTSDVSLCNNSCWNVWVSATNNISSLTEITMETIEFYDSTCCCVVVKVTVVKHFWRKMFGGDTNLCLQSPKLFFFNNL